MATHPHRGVLFTRRLLALIVVGCFARPTLADDPPKDFGQLQREFRAAYNKADYDKALKIAETMHEQRPEHVDTIYNIACMHCLKGDKAKAYKWLEKAVDAGYDDASQLRTDADFRTIRGEDRFRKIVRQVQRRERKASDDSSSKTEKEKEDEDEEPEAKEPEQREKPGDASTMGAQQRQRKVLALAQKVVQASEAKEYDKGLKHALEAAELADGGDRDDLKSLSHYNVACMYAQTGKKDKAFEHLNKAIVLGGFGEDLAGQIENDSDFEDIRDDPRYEKALAKARGASGGNREGFLWQVTPLKGAAAKKPAPLLVVLHGNRSNMLEASQKWQAAAQRMGAILLAPQGTTQISEGKYDWGSNLDEIEENILDAINKVMDEHKVDQGQVVLAGFSQGGWIAWSLGARNPDTFRGLIPVCGRFDAPSESEIDEEALAKLRIYAMVGADDDEAILKSNRDAEKRFKKLGAKVKLRVYDDVGHAYPDDAEAEELQALEFVLGN